MSGLVNDVRTLLEQKDPEMLEIIANIRELKKMMMPKEELKAA